MLIKALFKTILFVGLLVLLSWIPRLGFHLTVNQDFNYAQLFSADYLITSVLFDIKTISYWFGFLFLILLIEFIIPKARFLFLKRAVAALLITAFLVFCFIAVFYFPTTKTIVGKEVFTIIGGQDASIVSGYAREYWWAIIGIILFCALFTFLLLKIKIDLKGWGKFTYIVLCLAFWALAARGSLSLKPLNHLDAYAKLPADLAVSAMSPAYILLESINQQGLVDYKYLDESQLKEEQNKDFRTYHRDSVSQPNFCLILLESFGVEYTGLNAVEAPSYTPFLDSLAKDALLFTNAYSNGLRSMDAVASIFLGVPALMNMPYVGSLYAHNKVSSLYDFLKNQNYSSSFYHGADVESMGFSPFLRSHGLQEYFGLQDYPLDENYDGHWGVFDVPYFTHFAQELGNKEEPWISTFFSLSSHHPYSVPDGFDHLKEGSLPIHRSVRYTDEALKYFFDKIGDEPWFSNTIFIITADHSSVNEHKRYQTANGKYAVPLMLYAPDLIQAKEVNAEVQHLDILPTILDITGYDQEFFSFGQSLLDSSGRTIVHFDGATYSLTRNGYTLSLSGDEPRALYNNNTDPEHLKDLKDEEVELRDEMAHELKVRIQNFNHRLISNTYQ